LNPLVGSGVESVDKNKLQPQKRLEKEFVAEFDYSPGLCGHTYRMVVRS
jgi:hypothetical protein